MDIQAVTEAVRGLAPYFHVNSSRLPSSCIYSSVSSRAGWWCCPFVSIPVEEVNSRRNMSFRLYRGIHAECASIISTITPDVQIEPEMTLITVICVAIGFVVIIFTLSTAIVCLVKRVRRRRAAMRASASSARYYVPLLGSLGDTVSTLMCNDDSVVLPNLVRDVREASASLSERIAAERARQTGEPLFYGRSCSTFRNQQQGITNRAVSGQDSYQLEVVAEVETSTLTYDEAA